MLVPPLYMNPTVRNNVVDPFDVVGAVTVLSSVLTHAIVWATAVWSRILTITNCPSTADVVVMVIVRVPAASFVTVFRR